MLVTKHLLGFSIGALAASVSPIVTLLISPFIILLACLRKHVFSIAVLFLAGVVWVAGHWLLKQDASLKEQEGKLKVQIMGEVSNLKRQEYRMQFDLDDGERLYLISCYQCKLDINNGDHWYLDINLKPFHSLQNPQSFDYRSWMILKGYYAKGSVRGSSGVNRLIYESNEVGVRESVDQYLTPSDFPILRALILGDKSTMEVEQKRLVNEAGLSHLLVVSGMHIGMVAFATAFLLLWLQRPLLLINWSYSHQVALLASVVVAFSYAYLSGLNTPAARAVIMLIAGVTFLFLNRSSSPFVYFLFALFVIFMTSPMAFFDMGSWLSFGIVAGLIFGFYGRTPEGFWRGLLIAQYIAFLVGALVLLSFNQPVSLIGILGNLILIPLVSMIIVPLALLGVALSFSEFGWQILSLIERVLRSGVDILGYLKEWIQFSIPVNDANSGVWFIAFVVLIFSPFLRLYPLGITLVVIAWMISPKQPLYGSFEVTVLDVGQGSSALVQTQSKNILIDTGIGFEGGFTMVDFAVFPMLRAKGIEELDYVQITHNDNDHAGGIDQLRPITREIIKQGSCHFAQWEWDGVEFTRFQPKDYKTGNNGSCLLSVISQGGGSILFSGDIEKEAEKDLMINYPDHLKADVLLVPHHGSRTSSSIGFIEQVNPDLAIVSAGFLNRYNHPHSAIIQRYLDRSVKIYSTASHGAIEVVFSPRQANHIVSPYRPDFAFE